MRMLPVVFRWQDGHMVPEARYEKVARRQFAADEDYPMVVLEARSRASHNHFFASVDDAWHNLPEDIAIRWPTAEHLRKWVLVETGWFDEKDFNCESPARAKELAAFIRKVAEYARIIVHGKQVIVREAKSQSEAAMGKEMFQKSKRDVLDLLAAMIGTTRGTLSKEAGRSA